MFFCTISTKSQVTFFERQPSHWAYVYVRHTSWIGRVIHVTKMGITVLRSLFIIYLLCHAICFRSCNAWCWVLLVREPVENEEDLNKSTHTLGPPLRENLAREGLGTMRRSNQLLSPNPNLNAYLHLAMGDKFTTAKLTIKLMINNICFFLSYVKCHQSFWCQDTAFTHFLWVDVLYIQNTSSSFD